MSTSPKEWPLIFTAYSVKAMLAGKKSQTRRVPGPGMWSVDGGPWPRGWRFDLANARLDHGPSPSGNSGPYLHAQRVGADTIHRLYPLVQVGDRIVGRETWMPAIDAGGGPFRYAADYDAEGRAGMAELQRWRSPIFMPRRAARLVRDVVARRVERLQQINEEDALAEGVEEIAGNGVPEYIVPGALARKSDDPLASFLNPSQAFACGWDDLHREHPGCAWKDDPWVLALTYGEVTG